MSYIIIALLLLGILSPKPGDQKRKRRQKKRPWYDISYEDIILYDLMDDD